MYSLGAALATHERHMYLGKGIVDQRETQGYAMITRGTGCLAYDLRTQRKGICEDNL